MSNDMPEEIYVRKVTKKTLSAIRPESPILLGCLDGKLMRTKYIRADLVPQWQLMETAPEDGSYFLIWCEQTGCVNNKKRHVVTSIRDGYFTDLMFYDEPKFWMQLPKPPTEE